MTSHSYAIPADPLDWLVEDQPPPTRRGRRTRELVVQAARELFQQRAYAEVSVADITERSGLSVGTFYRYFTNKEELFIFLLSQVFREMYLSTRGSWDTKGDPLENFQRSTSRYLKSYWDNRQLLRCASEVVARSEGVRRMWWSMRRDLYDHMLLRLREDQSASDIDPLDPLLTIRALGGMVEEYARRAIAEGEFGQMAQEDIEPASNVLARIWYRTVFGDQSRRRTQPEVAAGITPELAARQGGRARGTKAGRVQ